MGKPTGGARRSGAASPARVCAMNGADAELGTCQAKPEPQRPETHRDRRGDPERSAQRVAEPHAERLGNEGAGPGDRPDPRRPDRRTSLAAAALASATARRQGPQRADRQQRPGREGPPAFGQPLPRREHDQACACKQRQRHRSDPMDDHPAAHAVGDFLHLLAEVGMDRAVAEEGDDQENGCGRESGARDPHPGFSV